MQPYHQQNQIYRDPRVFRDSAYRTQTELPEATQQRLKALQQEGAKPVAKLLKEVPRVPEEPTVQVQTAQYLEAFPDRVEEAAAYAQTDPMQESAEPAPYRAPPQGVDKATEILKDELFNFDREVQPMLDVLIGATLQQALQEFADEEEIKAIRRARTELRRRKQAELQEIRRLEEAERRKREEIARRQAEDLKRLQIEQEIAKKFAAAAFAQKFTAQLESDVLQSLEAKGAFQSSLENAVTAKFVPDILVAGMEKAKARERIHELLKAMIRTAVGKGVQMENGA